MHGDPKRQRLGDVWDDTVVVHAADPATRQSQDLGRAVSGAALGLLGRCLVDVLLFS